MKNKSKAVKAGEFRLGFLVHDVSRLRRTVVDKALAPRGITRSQWWVLANLSRHDGEGMMQTELARVLDIGKVALGGLVDRLEINGYVMRRPDLLDRRAKRIELTDSGAELLAAIQDEASQLNREMMQEISGDEIVATEDILHRMKVRLVEMDKELRRKGQNNIQDAD
jgi:MarR family transcriptional regulator, transcriptional regulator for hemolysin